MGCCGTRTKDQTDFLQYDLESSQCAQVSTAEKILGYSNIQASYVAEMYAKHAKETWLSEGHLNIILSEFGAKRYDSKSPKKPENEFYSQYSSAGKFVTHDLLITSILLASGMPSSKASLIFSAYNTSKSLSLKVIDVETLFTELFEFALRMVVLAETSDNTDSLKTYKAKLKGAVPKTVANLINKFVGDEDTCSMHAFVNLIAHDSDAVKVVSARGLRNLLMQSVSSYQPTS